MKYMLIIGVIINFSVMIILPSNELRYKGYSTFIKDRYTKQFLARIYICRDWLILISSFYNASYAFFFVFFVYEYYKY